MNPDKNYERRIALRELLEKTPFEFEFMSINDDVELTPVAIAKNHDSKRAIDALGRDLTRGELASTLNHMLCFKTFLNSNGYLLGQVLHPCPSPRSVTLSAGTSSSQLKLLFINIPPFLLTNQGVDP